jgi:hypothetical protein
MTERTARCLCGQLTAVTRGEPARVLMCSCADCRAKSGSAFAVSTYWDEADMAFARPTRAYWSEQRPGWAGEIGAVEQLARQ